MHFLTYLILSVNSNKPERCLSPPLLSYGYLLDMTEWLAELYQLSGMKRRQIESSQEILQIVISTTQSSYQAHNNTKINSYFNIESDWQILLALMETWKLQTAMLLEESVYTCVTVVFPAMNISPDVCVLYNKVTLPDSSVAYGPLHVMTSPCNPTSIVVEISAGQSEILGAWVSTKFKRKQF